MNIDKEDWHGKQNTQRNACSKIFAYIALKLNASLHSKKPAPDSLDRCTAYGMEGDLKCNLNKKLK